MNRVKDKYSPLPPEAAADIRQCVKILRAGGIILYPTDTVWGLGCDATNDKAVNSIYALKQRKETKSMLVLMKDTDMVSQYIDRPEEIALQLMEQTDKPVTVILAPAVGLSANLIAPDTSVGIRIPDDTFCQQLLKAFQKPIVSTSANISGETTPGLFAEISDKITENVDYVVNYRRNDTTRHKPSSIIKISDGGVFKIIRK